MLQQINLYKEPKLKNVILPGKQIIALNIFLLVVLVICTVFKLINYQLNSIKVKKTPEIKITIKEEATNQVKPQSIQEQKQHLSDLKQQKESAEKKYNILLELNNTEFKGLSAYLNAMAEPETNEMWINQFNFIDNAKSIHFEGITLNHGVILKYLEDLGKTAAFSDKKITNLKIFIDDKTKQIKFIVDA